MYRWIRLFTIATVNCVLLCAAAYAQANNLQPSGSEHHGQASFAVFNRRHVRRLTGDPLHECVKRTPK